MPDACYGPHSSAGFTGQLHSNYTARKLNLLETALHFSREVTPHLDAGAIACTTAAVLMPQDLTMCIFGMTVDHKYLWLCFALALWGLGQGAGPVVEALLADSTHTG